MVGNILLSILAILAHSKYTFDHWYLTMLSFLDIWDLNIFHTYARLYFPKT